MPPTRSRKRKDRDGPPRPSNAWIIYRTEMLARMKEEAGDKKIKQSSASTLVAEMWKNESAEVRQIYEKEADIRKAKHAEMYPGYKYRPKSRAQKALEKAEAKRLAAEKKEARRREAEEAKASRSGSRKASKRKSQTPSPADACEQPSSSTQSIAPPRPAQPSCPRGRGPSPPLDSDDESSLYSSAPSTSSSVNDDQAIPPAESLQAPQPSYTFDFSSTLTHPDTTQATIDPALVQLCDAPPSYSEGSVEQINAAQVLQLGPHNFLWNQPEPPRSFNDPRSPFPEGLPIAMPNEPVDMSDVLKAIQSARDGFVWQFPPQNIHGAAPETQPENGYQLAVAAAAISPTFSMSSGELFPPALDLDEFHQALHEAAASEASTRVNEAQPCFSFDELEGLFTDEPQLLGGVESQGEYMASLALDARIGYAQLAANSAAAAAGPVQDSFDSSLPQGGGQEWYPQDMDALAPNAYEQGLPGASAGDAAFGQVSYSHVSSVLPNGLSFNGEPQFAPPEPHNSAPSRDTTNMLPNGSSQVYSAPSSQTFSAPSSQELHAPSNGIPTSAAPAPRYVPPAAGSGLSRRRVAMRFPRPPTDDQSRASASGQRSA
ncbi:hypothetical protein C8Q77DRAFT_1157845 [Trametes polyzona]|nr:hypothetical protein C8Q77DRAFT_1157845 [Trametes polyzona]